MNQRRAGPIIGAVVVVLLLLFGAYMGSYYAMLEGGVETLRMSEVGEEFWYEPAPLYRFHSNLNNDGAIESIFYPAHQCDRLMRPDYWRVSPTIPNAELGFVDDE